MSTIMVRNLTRDYGSGRGVFDVSFTVGEGEVYGFLGPNGAGKTTTIRHLLGFLKPQSGDCSINGQNCWQDHAAISRNLGYIPGEIGFIDNLTGTEFLKFMEKYRGLTANNRTSELLDRFDLDPRGKLKKMSKGMKQKIGIIAAFMHDPETLILDEPTSGLDPLMQSRFIELIIEERKRGKTILLSSHMFEEVERTCHRVSIIRNGRLVAEDSVNALKQARVKTYIVTLQSEQAVKDFAAAAKNVRSVADTRVTVAISGDLPELLELMHRSPVTNLEAPVQSLEEIFMQYYGGEQHA